MATIRLVNLMKVPVRLKFKENAEVVIPTSGAELTIVRPAKMVGLAGEGSNVYIMSEVPSQAIGIPEQVDRNIRYIVTAVAFESLSDRKDFVTPAKPVRDNEGVVRAYKYLRGHAKEEVTEFFKELGRAVE